ncbi:phosphotransferase [Salinisphaera sp. USBA-960]|uniref:fructosamine kinase family protein n=1 Tax=Salinisphaera orenii TaxID=856731 RepID=UPI0013A613ED|nr:phosphotransferase [Salifodinibacter halophilus]NNC27237.1 phosphotransferase [Salifodinibacter halophilus]
MRDWPAIRAALEHQTGASLTDAHVQPVGGGDVSDSFCVDAKRRRLFVKREPASNADRLHAEAAGLDELRQAAQIRVPEVLAVGATEASAYLALEYVDLCLPDEDGPARLGDALAEMHDIVSPTYGWRRDNYIGMNPQSNHVTGDWVEFFRENRLRVMVDALAMEFPTLAARSDRLLTSLRGLVCDHQPEAALVHGDLWAGNVGFDYRGTPVLFDPAVYYGDRETDLALAELFGGFSPLFFEAYWRAWPMPSDYRRVRRPLYQLYHLLNHVRHFGAGFVDRSRVVVDGLLAEIADG